MKIRSKIWPAAIILVIVLLGGVPLMAHMQGWRHGGMRHDGPMGGMKSWGMGPGWQCQGRFDGMRRGGPMGFGGMRGGMGPGWQGQGRFGRMMPGPGGFGMQPGGPMGRPMMGPERVFMAMRKLDLSQEQREQIKDIFKNSREKMKQGIAETAKARKGLQEAVISGAGEEAIRDAAGKVGEAIGNAAMTRADTLKQIKAKLTDEQLKKFNEKLAAKPKWDGPRRRPDGESLPPKPDGPEQN